MNSVAKALLFKDLRHEVDAINKVLERTVSSQVELVERVSKHTLNAGGKRLRPLLVMICAKTIGLPFDTERTRKLAAAMELIHMATLMHDDVIDNAPLRRGIKTANEIAGNTASILTGDALLARAMVLLALDGDLEIIRTVSQAVVDLAEGEILELEVRGDYDLTKEKHFEVLRRKTATFIQACCTVGARCAGASEDQVRALGEFGLNIGYAFQVADDLLDYRGKETGKAVGTDFLEGCATLPLICLRTRLNQQDDATTREAFGCGGPDDVAKVVSWMDQTGAFSQTEAIALEFIDKAKASLKGLKDSDEVRLLGLVGDYILSRTD